MLTFLQKKVVKIGLNVFPNPFDGNFGVNARFEEPEKVQLSVINAHGQVVFEETYPPMMDLNQNLSLYHLPNGIYFVRLTTSKGQAMQKMTLMRL